MNKNKKLLWLFLTVGVVFFIVPARAEILRTQIGTGNMRIKTDTVTSKITIVTSGTIDTGTNFFTGTIISTGTNTGNIILPPPTYTGTEFEQALAWMYTNGLTKYNNETEYRGDDWLTREEAAKIVGQAFIKLGYNQNTKNSSCTFSDAHQIDPTLSGFVTNTCKRGIFKGTTDNKFLPTQKLSRPQAMALLIRIFEGKVSNESNIPRWGEYYTKGKVIGLTTLNSQGAFDVNITRKEIAIYVYRLRNIVSNETIKILMMSKLNELGTEQQNSTSGMLDNFGTLADSLSINNDPELLEAIRWMNDNGLTNFKTITEYKPFEILNREQTAKILYNFREVFSLMKTGHNAATETCTFKDASSIDASLITFVEQACAIGMMNGSNGYFNPKGTINKSEFIAAVIRLFEGKKLDETPVPRRTNYFKKAQEIGMIGPADAVTFENPITRYEVALFLYRFKVKYQILQNMNNNTIQNQVVSTVPGSIKTGANNMPESYVYVDMNLLQNGNFEVGYIEIFGQRYKVVKANTDKYFTNNFIRYGDLFSLDKEEQTGTTNFIVSNFALIEGKIRIGDTTFTIDPINNTNAYYKIYQTK